MDCRIIDTKKGMQSDHIDLMRHMHKIDDFYGFVPEGNRNQGKMAGVEYGEINWQHLGGGFRKILWCRRKWQNFL